jgi:hypothetical protein
MVRTRPVPGPSEGLRLSVSLRMGGRAVSGASYCRQSAVGAGEAQHFGQ